MKSGPSSTGATDEIESWTAAGEAADRSDACAIRHRRASWALASGTGGRYAAPMRQWLIVMEAQSKAPTYTVLLDVLERRLAARRLLRTAWVVEAGSAQAVYDSLVYYRPYNDGLLILPFSEDRVERNLRGDPATPPVVDTDFALAAVDQVTPN